MTTPHRGLPPPAAMALPSPTQASSSTLGPLPQAWQNSEETSKVWLQAKMEEERRRAEEERTRQEQERTRQEQQRADTRRVEVDLLREALRGGIPPPLVPLLFMGSVQNKAQSVDWMNEHFAQYMSAMAQQQQQQQHLQHQVPPAHIQHPPPPPSPQQQPALRREHRQIQQIHQVGGPGPPVQQMGPPTTGPPVVHAGPPPPGYIASYPIAGPGAPPRTVLPPQQSPPQGGPPLRSSLPRINTTEVQIHQPQPPVPQNVPMQMVSGPMPSVHHPPTAPAENSQGAQSPAIFFHHWVPPTSQPGGASGQNQNAASPGAQRQLDSPFTSHPPSNALTGLDEYTSPPKKRKANTGQPQPPAPGGSQVPFSPNSGSSTPARRGRGHSRHRSDTSGSGGHVARGFEPYNRPNTRQRRSIGESSLHISEAVSGTGSGPVSPKEERDGTRGPEQQHQPQTHQQQQQNQSQEQREQHVHTQQQGQSQQHRERESTAPPAAHNQPPHPVQRPYSAGPDWKPPYPPPPPQQQSDAAGEGKGGNG